MCVSMTFTYVPAEHQEYLHSKTEHQDTQLPFRCLITYSGISNSNKLITTINMLCMLFCRIWEENIKMDVTGSGRWSWGLDGVGPG
jgi:hypothetical protein